MKQGIEIPKWAIGAGIAGVVLVLVFVGLRIGGGEGQRNPSTYPKSAYAPPSYGKPPSSAAPAPGAAPGTAQGGYYGDQIKDRR